MKVDLKTVRHLIKEFGRDFTNDYLSVNKIVSDYDITVTEAEMLLKLCKYYRDCDLTY